LVAVDHESIQNRHGQGDAVVDHAGVRVGVARPDGDIDDLGGVRIDTTRLG
jgi:hypothetical protein